MCNFPEYFHSLFASHMTLCEMDKHEYYIIPPNQCDWKYTLNKIDNNTWKVYGEKNDIHYPLPQFISYVYKRDKSNLDEWRHHEYPQLQVGGHS